MDTAYILSVAQESLYLIIVFSLLLVIGMWKGRYALITIIFSLYLALLFTVEFPYADSILQNENGGRDALTLIGIFIGFTLTAFFLFRRHIPGDDYEGAFEGFWKKLLLALVGSGLILAFSYHVLPVTDFIHPGTPIQTLFGSSEHFFWWLLAPIIVLFLV